MITAVGSRPFTVVVGAGGVGKTTIAAALGLMSARAGRATLVMTFDPSLRLKDTLGIGERAIDRVVQVEAEPSARLHASLLDARATFDRLVARYAPDEASRERILRNRFYDQLAGHLGGILEYMAVERLFEIVGQERFEHVILDTPPTQQAIDFLEAPDRVTGFLDSGALKIALRPWFDAEGHLRGASRLGVLGRRLEDFLDRVVGLDLLRDMAEFFQAFGPLYAGFRERAVEVGELLRSDRTSFLLVAGPGKTRVPDTMYFARKLEESGHSLAGVVINRVHPLVSESAKLRHAGRDLLRWLGRRDHEGLEALTELLPSELPRSAVPLLPGEPNRLEGLIEIGRLLGATAGPRLDA